jgi:hypothetical protein
MRKKVGVEGAGNEKKGDKKDKEGGGGGGRGEARTTKNLAEPS